MTNPTRFFAIPVGASLAILALVFLFGGTGAFITVALLSILEVTLSFDNAVVNAKVLKEMTLKWRARFLTWGMLIAVVGVRLILPVLIVSGTVLLSPLTVTKLALFNPSRYATLLLGVHFAISAFGACFLLLVALHYFLDDGKEVHWIRIIEHRLARLGNSGSLEIVITLAALFLASFFVPVELRAGAVLAGLVGVILFVAMRFLMSSLSINPDSHAAGRQFGLFVYLNILDAAFSLDGVVGAFALSTSIPLIVLGLGIGAYFVRSITLYLVHHRTLESLRYLEHGAHWAIFGLAASMFANLIIAIPGFITGSIGLVFVMAAYFSSVRFLKKA